MLVRVSRKEGTVTPLLVGEAPRAWFRVFGFFGFFL